MIILYCRCSLERVAQNWTFSHIRKLINDKSVGQSIDMQFWTFAPKVICSIIIIIANRNENGHRHRGTHIWLQTNNLYIVMKFQQAISNRQSAIFNMNENE